ncbi:MAG: ion transporter [Polyangiales bacterium]
MSARDFLHAAFHEPRARAYRVVETFVWVLVFASIALLFAEPFVVEGSREDHVLGIVDRVILWLFSIEVSLRILTFRPPELTMFVKPPLGRLRTEVVSRVRFALTPLMLVDILTILALVPALRGLRALRLLRLLRTARLFRYANPFYGIFRALQEDRLLFTFAFSVLGVETILGGISLYLVERTANPEINSVGDGLWWALVTITTVGFGDITPETTVGRFIGGTMMVGGMFTLALFAGIVGHSLLNAVLSIREEQFRMSGYVNHIVVCGYEMGSGMLLDVLVSEIDTDERPVVFFGPYQRPRTLPPEFMWVEGDPTKETELDKARITQAANVIITGARRVRPQEADAATILTAFTIRAHLSKSPLAATRKKPLHIVAEVLDSENVLHVRTAGADEVVETRRVGYSLLAHAVAYPGVADATSRVVFPGHQNLYVGAIPDHVVTPASFTTVSEQIRDATGCMVIGIRDPVTGTENINPPSDSEVRPDMQLVYLSNDPKLDPP